MELTFTDMTLATDIDTDIERVACAFIANVAANFDLINALLFGDRNQVPGLELTHTTKISPVGCADRKETHQSRDSLKTGKQTK